MPATAPVLVVGLDGAGEAACETLALCGISAVCLNDATAVGAGAGYEGGEPAVQRRDQHALERLGPRYPGCSFVCLQKPLSTEAVERFGAVIVCDRPTDEAVAVSCHAAAAGAAFFYVKTFGTFAKVFSAAHGEELHREVLNPPPGDGAAKVLHFAAMAMDTFATRTGYRANGGDAPGVQSIMDELMILQEAAQRAPPPKDGAGTADAGGAVKALCHGNATPWRATLVEAGARAGLGAARFLWRAGGGAPPPPATCWHYVDNTAFACHGGGAPAAADVYGVFGGKRVLLCGVNALSRTLAQLLVPLGASLFIAHADLDASLQAVERRTAPQQRRAGAPPPAKLDRQAALRAAIDAAEEEERRRAPEAHAVAAELRGGAAGDHLELLTRIAAVELSSLRSRSDVEPSLQESDAVVACGLSPRALDDLGRLAWLHHKPLLVAAADKGALKTRCYLPFETATYAERPATAENATSATNLANATNAANAANATNVANAANATNDGTVAPAATGAKAKGADGAAAALAGVGGGLCKLAACGLLRPLHGALRSAPREEVQELVFGAGGGAAAAAPPPPPRVVRSGASAAARGRRAVAVPEGFSGWDQSLVRLARKGSTADLAAALEERLGKGARVTEVAPLVRGAFTPVWREGMEHRGLLEAFAAAHGAELEAGRSAIFASVAAQRGAEVDLLVPTVLIRFQ